MCTPVVIDASSFAHVHDESEGSAGGQLRKWIVDGHGLVAYTNAGRCGRELARDKKMLALFLSFRQRGVARLFSEEQVQAKEVRLREYATASGQKDRGMLALAAAADARVLVACDNALKADFRDRQLPHAKQDRRVFPLEGRSKVRRDFLQQRRCSRR